MKPHLLSYLAFMVLAMVPRHSFAKDYLDELKDFKKKIPPKKQQAWIENLLKKHADDPEAYVLSANWYWSDGRDEFYSPTAIPAGNYLPELSKKDPGDGTFYLAPDALFQEEFIHDPASQTRATQILAAAQRRFPNRLDIVLGLQRMFFELNRVDDELEKLNDFIKATHAYSNHLLWEHGQPLEEEKTPDFVKGVLLDILNECGRLASPRDEAVFIGVARIFAAEMPNSIEAVNALALACHLQSDVRGEYHALKRALEINPSDDVVLENWQTLTFHLGLMADAKAAANRLLGMKANPDYQHHAQIILNGIQAYENAKED